MASKKKVKKTPQAESYQHPTAETLLRPEVGTQAQFRKKKPAAIYRYDSSLDPAMKNSTSLTIFLAHRMAFYGDQSLSGLFRTV